MKTSRRAFLGDLAWAGLGAAYAGQACFGGPAGRGPAPIPGAARMGAAYAPVKNLRIGMIGLGGRGSSAVGRLAAIGKIVPGVEIAALCDLVKNRAERQRDWLVKQGERPPKVYGGAPDAWMALCDSPDVDLVYIATPWTLHAPMALRAMRSGRHAAVEVPMAVTLDECWELVETSEKTGRHCMMLENCCYGKSELFALMLCRNNVLGTLVHGEGGYLHYLRDRKFGPRPWRLEYSKDHTGNPYPTHGLGPICQCMNINRGDKMDYLVSVSSGQFGLTEYARERFGADSDKARAAYALGDMNTSVIRTYRGRTIMVQHNTTDPRPYSRINLIQGTKGVLADYPLRVALGHSWMDDRQLGELKKKYAHPLWQKNGEIAKKVGGHGGMDFLMDLRLCHCLANGLPLDIDVYDSALWSCLVPLTEKSARGRGAPVDVPDFTRGAWRTAKPLGIVTV